jgi:hypothetical protein
VGGASQRAGHARLHPALPAACLHGLHGAPRNPQQNHGHPAATATPVRPLPAPTTRSRRFPTKNGTLPCGCAQATRSPTASRRPTSSCGRRTRGSRPPRLPPAWCLKTRPAAWRQQRRRACERRWLAAGGAGRQPHPRLQRCRTVPAVCPAAIVLGITRKRCLQAPVSCCSRLSCPCARTHTSPLPRTPLR